MNRWFNIVIAFLFSVNVSAQTKLIGDYTLEMSTEVSDTSGVITARGIKTIAVSGKKVRVDYRSDRIIQSAIIDYNSNTAVFLRETNDSKYLRRLNAADWKRENSKFEGIKYQYTSETKKILDLDCKSAVALLKDGTRITVFYTPSVSAVSTENNFEFNSLPGLVLEYTLTNTSGSVRFVATTIDFDPVPASKFNVPTSGYRLLQ